MKMQLIKIQSPINSNQHQNAFALNFITMDNLLLGASIFSDLLQQIFSLLRLNHSATDTCQSEKRHVYNEHQCPLIIYSSPAGFTPCHHQDLVAICAVSISPKRQQLIVGEPKAHCYNKATHWMEWPSVELALPRIAICRIGITSLVNMSKN